MTLNELGIKYNTDKADFGKDEADVCHSYTYFYELLFKDRQEKVKTVLEIGILKGASLRMWQDYFPEAMIYGIDIHTYDQYPDGKFDNRIQYYWADQNVPADLIGVINKINAPIDFIVDDGSHKLEHQLTSLRTLFPFLADGGLYVIEDINDIDDIEPYLKGNFKKYWLVKNQEGFGSILAIIQK